MKVAIISKCSLSGIKSCMVEIDGGKLLSLRKQMIHLFSDISATGRTWHSYLWISIKRTCEEQHLCIQGCMQRCVITEVGAAYCMLLSSCRWQWQLTKLKIMTILSSYVNNQKQTWMFCALSLEGWDDKTNKYAEWSTCPEQFILTLQSL